MRYSYVFRSLRKKFQVHENVTTSCCTSKDQATTSDTSDK